MSLAVSLIRFLRDQVQNAAGDSALEGIEKERVDYAPVNREAVTGSGEGITIGISVAPGFQEAYLGGGVGPSEHDVTVFISAKTDRKKRRKVEDVSEAVRDLLVQFDGVVGGTRKVISSELVATSGDEPEDEGLNTHQLDFTMLVV